jgi:hypothetical protein
MHRRQGSHQQQVLETEHSLPELAPALIVVEQMHRRPDPHQQQVAIRVRETGRFAPELVPVQTMV